MKLELRHIAPYLPYGVKFCPKGEPDVQLEIGNIYLKKRGRTNNVVSVLDIGTYDHVKSEWKLSEIQLVLHPVSDLTKQIVHEEREFVPLVKLFMISDDIGADASCADVSFEIMSHSAILIHQGDYRSIYFGLIQSQSGSYSFSSAEYHHKSRMHIEASGNLGKHVDLFDSSEFLLVRNQLRLFEKLFEWHFDVFGLIPAGLAIDINTLNQKQP